MLAWSASPASGRPPLVCHWRRTAGGGTSDSTTDHFLGFHPPSHISPLLHPPFGSDFSSDGCIPRVIKKFPLLLGTDRALRYGSNLGLPVSERLPEDGISLARFRIVCSAFDRRLSASDRTRACQTSAVPPRVIEYISRVTMSNKVVVSNRWIPLLSNWGRIPLPLSRR